MTRLLFFVAAAVLALVGLVAAVGVLAYGTEPAREGELTLDGLDGPVAMAWMPEGGVTIEAGTLPDALAGLGYAHAADSAWPMVWLRQVARGTAAESLGDAYAAQDVHARRLGLDGIAQRTYNDLPGAERALLDAYARGVNRALSEAGVAQSNPFVLLDLTADRWEPWDALAVERLLAYLGTPDPSADSLWTARAADSPGLARFVRSDSLFRAAVAAGGASYDRAFTVPTADGITLVQHHVQGATALPLLAPVVLRIGGRSVVALSVPGTLLFPGGAGPEGAWSVFLSSRLDAEPFAGKAPPLVHSRVVERDGDERLLGFRRDSTGLVVGRATRRDTVRTPADSLAAPQQVPQRVPQPAPLPVADTLAVPTGQWLIRWAGFREGTDLAPFVDLLEGRAPRPFRLFRGAGLTLGAGGSGVLGTPPVALSSGTVTLVAEDPAAGPALSRLLALANTTERPERVAGDAWSPRAARLLPAMLGAMGDRDSLDLELQEPYSYLRSWPYTYTADAIGAVLFETWLDAHASVTGAPPDPRDTLDAALLPYTLRIARAELRDRYGTDATQWRWSRVQGGPRYPVLARRGGTAARRYHLAEVGDGGHPTALRPGPTRPDSVGEAGPAVWTAWVSLADGRLYVRPPRRVLATDDGVEGGSLAPGEILILRLDVPLPRARLTLRPPA